jgi:hypothetical protein
MSTTIHLSLDIQGYLMNHTHKRDYAGMFIRDGRPMSAEKSKRELLHQLSLGRKVLPVGTCEGFNYQTGCPGHESPHPTPGGQGEEGKR